MTLVLAGGGPAALAWELGVLRGLADADPDWPRRSSAPTP
jgi:predicted acylesterase/phospholipase RssA